MKKLLFTILAGTVLLLSAENRKAEISGPTGNVGEMQITGNLDNPVVRFAARELQSFLKQSTGKEVPVGGTIAPDKFNLILGDHPEARKDGLDLSKLPDEGYYIRRIGNRLYIAGNDSPETDPARNKYRTNFRRATLSGVYDFLERFTDARFFFPGKYGTIVPARDGLYLPGKIDIMESPDMLIRNLYYGGKCQPYDPAIPMPDIYSMTHLRLRLSEKRIYFGHGLAALELVERFGKSHPEYFALRDDGRRYNDPNMPYPCQLCFTSGVGSNPPPSCPGLCTAQPVPYSVYMYTGVGGNGYHAGAGILGLWVLNCQ